MIGRLPQTLTVCGAEHQIRTDFRDVLQIIENFQNPELSEEEKAYIMLIILYRDFESFDPLHDDLEKAIVSIFPDVEEACQKAAWFIDCGKAYEEKPGPKLMDWEQDESIIFPAINKVAGVETRCLNYLHWWTFMGYFMEIGDGLFSQVLNIRQKKSKGKKLEKWEKEFYRDNKGMCDLTPRLTKEEQAEKERLEKLLGGL